VWVYHPPGDGLYDLARPVNPIDVGILDKCIDTVAEVVREPNVITVEKRNVGTLCEV
jgi:hypothetical protein